MYILINIYIYIFIYNDLRFNFIYVYYIYTILIIYKMDTIIVEQKQKSDHLDVRTKDLAYRVNLLNNRFTENGLNVNTLVSRISRLLYSCDVLCTSYIHIYITCV